MKIPFFLLLFGLAACQNSNSISSKIENLKSNATPNTESFINKEANTLLERLVPPSGYTRVVTVEGSWNYFLQHQNLLNFDQPIFKYDGTKIEDQIHHIGILTYDVGTKDLQQCADALIRLRAEYLFKHKRYSDIGFEFTSGDHYSWTQYAQGIRPKITGSSVNFNKLTNTIALDDRIGFRNYLDIIYTYAGTISLAKSLKEIVSTTEFNIGDVINTPGSPGHIIMVIDKVSKENKHLYALVEGYTPAQSIHILSENNNPWFDIQPTSVIVTPRYIFKNPVFKRFE